MIWRTCNNKECRCPSRLFSFFQVLGTTVWFIVEPPATRHFFPDPNHKSAVILKCKVKDASFLVSLVYNIGLICTCTIYAIKTRKIPENFKWVANRYEALELLCWLCSFFQWNRIDTHLLFSSNVSLSFSLESPVNPSSSASLCIRRVSFGWLSFLYSLVPEITMRWVFQTFNKHFSNSFEFFMLLRERDWKYLELNGFCFYTASLIIHLLRF